LKVIPGKGQERSQRDTRGHSWPKKVPKVLLIPTLERQTLYFRKEIAGYLNRDVRTARRREKEKRDMLLLDLAFGLVLLRPIHPEHVSGDFAGVGPRRASCPPVQSLVAVQNDPNMLRLVSVPDGVGISEAQLAAKRFDVVGFPSQEQQPGLTPWPLA